MIDYLILFAVIYLAQTTSILTFLAVDAWKSNRMKKR